jgi:hypothetical protein
MAPSGIPNMARFKTSSPSTPNTPSSFKLSPLTIFSQAADFLYNISHSPITASPGNIDSSRNVDSPRKIDSPHKIDSPRKIRAKVAKLPKNNHIPLKLDTPVKKNKKKTKGPVNAITSPELDILFKLNNPPEGKPRTTTKAKPVYDADTPYRCIICDAEVVEAERKQHFHGRPHGQTFGMLKDFKRCYVVKEKDLPKPDSRLLRVNKNEWRCPPCDESMPYPHKAKTMQDHLAMTAHKLAMEGLWVAFVRHMRSAFGLRDDEIPEFPQHLDDTIPQKPRDNGN